MRSAVLLSIATSGRSTKTVRPSVVMQAAQDLLLDKVEVGIEKIRLTARLHLAHVGLQVAMALGKGCRLLIMRHRLIPPLKTGLIEAVERANVVDPGEHPTLELWPTACRLEKIPSHMRPAIGQNELVMVLGEAFVGA